MNFQSFWLFPAVPDADDFSFPEDGSGIGDGFPDLAVQGRIRLQDQAVPAVKVRIVGPQHQKGAFQQNGGENILQIIFQDICLFPRTETGSISPERVSHMRRPCFLVQPSHEAN